MERVKVSKYFYLDELVDPETYLLEFDLGLSKIDKSAFDLLDKVRELYGKPIVINTWWTGETDLNKILSDKNTRKYSGFRSKLCTIGAVNSAHRKGKAFDIKGNPSELLKLVENNSALLYSFGLRRIEDTSITPTWFHFDLWDKNNTKGIEVVDLKRVVKIISLK